MTIPFKRYMTIQGRVLVKEFFCSKKRNKDNCLACDRDTCAGLGPSDLHRWVSAEMADRNRTLSVGVCLWAGEKERKKRK